MAWYDYVDMESPTVFSPKVRPDPIAAERLEEKLQQAMRKLKPLHRPQRSDPLLAVAATATRQID